DRVDRGHALDRRIRPRYEDERINRESGRCGPYRQARPRRPDAQPARRRLATAIVPRTAPESTNPLTLGPVLAALGLGASPAENYNSQGPTPARHPRGPKRRSAARGLLVPALALRERPAAGGNAPGARPAVRAPDRLHDGRPGRT